MSGCLEQHKLSDAPIKRDRPLHCNEKSPHWRCNTIRTARHPFEWTSSHSWLQLISESSWWNRIIFYNKNETHINKESTSSKHHPIIRWVPHNEIPPTKLIFLRRPWPPRPPRIFVPLPWWPVIQMSNFFMWYLSIFFSEGHMTLKHREYRRLTGSTHVLGEPNKCLPLLPLRR